MAGCRFCMQKWQRGTSIQLPTPCGNSTPLGQRKEAVRRRWQVCSLNSHFPLPSLPHCPREFPASTKAQSCLSKLGSATAWQGDRPELNCQPLGLATTYLKSLRFVAPIGDISWRRLQPCLGLGQGHWTAQLRSERLCGFAAPRRTAAPSLYGPNLPIILGIACYAPDSADRRTPPPSAPSWPAPPKLT